MRWKLKNINWDFIKRTAIALFAVLVALITYILVNHVPLKGIVILIVFLLITIPIALIISYKRLYK
jgi:magnesium-transporting ATPase (P-type)